MVVMGKKENWNANANAGAMHECHFAYSNVYQALANEIALKWRCDVFIAGDCEC